MAYKKKFFNELTLNFIKKRLNKYSRANFIKTYIWLKSVGFIRGYAFLVINKKRQRLVRFNQANIGLNIYHSLYHNRPATFRAKVEKKKKKN